MVSLASLNATVAISILLSSPPDKELSISLSTYSLAHNPTFDKTEQDSALVKSLFDDILSKSCTVIPLNLTGC